MDSGVINLSLLSFALSYRLRGLLSNTKNKSMLTQIFWSWFLAVPDILICRKPLTWYHLLLKKLTYVVYSPTYTRWFDSYLRERIFRVCYGDQFPGPDIRSSSGLKPWAAFILDILKLYFSYHRQSLFVICRWYKVL